jgi:hypothetical protein
MEPRVGVDATKGSAVQQAIIRNRERTGYFPLMTYIHTCDLLAQLDHQPLRLALNYG